MRNALTLTYHPLIFRQPAGTSRGILTEKPTWFVEVNLPSGQKAIGEFSVIPGLSPEFDTLAAYENKLRTFLNEAAPFLTKPQVPSSFFSSDEGHYFYQKWEAFPSFIFGLETILYSIQANGDLRLIDSAFTRQESGIPINGLIWMGTIDDMRQQVKQKLDAQFRTLKFKIGAIGWEKEAQLLHEIRSHYSHEELVIRVDANGAFSAQEAPEILAELARLNVHSIEQPIGVNQRQEMASLCAKNTVPIALDEELIGIYGKQAKRELIEAIKPQYLILKPSLHGGLTGCNEWIELAQKASVGYWITSALESAVGLNMIAQYTATKDCVLPQGLGTGALYTNNVPGKLLVSQGYLQFTNDLQPG
jgi:L-alanine-DL-glutamate epimerase-like enolase superfamily enzyme